MCNFCNFCNAILIDIVKMVRVSLSVSALIGAVALASAAPAPLPTVDLGYGLWSASINDTGKHPYYTFSNIRYAVPPVGDLRFRAPVPPKHRNTTVNNGSGNPICPQANPAWLLTAQAFLTGTPIENLTRPGSGSGSGGGFSLDDIPKPAAGTTEDCLFLDVYAPKSIYDAPKVENKQSGAPVLVWIYGGGYTAGSKTGSGNPATLLDSARDGDEKGIIFVALNYRLGMFGWLSGPTYQASGTANIGLHDQRLALEWVQKNIHLFGGDPNRVTVIGESAGGGSIMHQITAYGGLKGKVPFQQAIVQSPGWVPSPSNYQNEAVFQKTLSFASLIAQKQVATVDDLRNLTTEQLYYTNYAVTGLSNYGTFTYGPTVDEDFAPKLPGELLLQGQFDKSLNVMLGHNSEEGFLFASPFVTSDTTLKEYLQGSVPAILPTALDTIVTDLYPPNFDGSLPYTTQLSRTSVLVSESVFTCNTRALNLAYGNNTYSYYFRVPPGLHGEDVAYTFFNGDTSTLNQGFPVDRTVAEALQDYITSFAMNGNPNEKGVPFFPLYGGNSSTQVIDIGKLGTQITDTTANKRCAWWQEGLYY
ncbi:hypothetical protein VC83_00616 [Pseudogymnoascus destructans]|uniref:Carboxylic ester hydrolase n=2 Tax=Pseudogymnoascus destructans TaxID=655981 RepID=L8G9B6_PSED2|nr:uncharacterized protein VC83_00616 [Pseudogymnoascus destructans]ELR09469.1 hypothetical protein GMDG_00651 [Pseudogymnoascus destructans 20631-21]OAF62992.1 hypothetical protein VC83_00616 [Pseudogymnoascus destructans]